MDNIHQTVQILEFLAHIHSKGYTYFDLKPENVLFNKDDNDMRVVDMGCMYPTSQRFNKGIGTLCYRTLSMWLCEPQNALSDMWAFGLLLFELWTDSPLTYTTDKNADEATTNKYVNLIVSQFGMPPASLLDKLEFTSRFFIKNEKGYTLKNPLNLPFKPWKSAMSECTKSGSAEEVAHLIDLIDKCLRYEDALTAKQALLHPFFKNYTTHFSIQIQPRNYVLWLYEESSSPYTQLMKLRLSDRQKLSCLHVKTQLKDRYIICLTSTENSEKLIAGPCSIYLRNHDRLLIRKNKFDIWGFAKEVPPKH